MTVTLRTKRSSRDISVNSGIHRNITSIITK